MYVHVGVSRDDTREKKAVESLLAAQVRRLEEEVASKENDYSQRMNVLQDKYRNMEVSYCYIVCMLKISNLNSENLTYKVLGLWDFY